ncbi:hypothetical protein ABT009_35015 [Streptomyces sp. NPDC002896]|uniref:hypothetical protein n=1 Tax=Streptomyces sp. NPDC002896 TaxID=3154438 RepID=UPI003318CF94
MTDVLIALALLALLVCGLERSHRRRPHPRPRLHGSADIEDRDAARVRDELRAAADRVAEDTGEVGSGSRAAADTGSGRHVPPTGDEADGLPGTCAPTRAHARVRPIAPPPCHPKAH